MVQWGESSTINSPDPFKSTNEQLIVDNVFKCVSKAVAAMYQEPDEDLNKKWKQLIEDANLHPKLKLTIVSIVG